MTIQVALLVLFTIYFTYLCYKVLWYLVKIASFRNKLRTLQKQGYRVEAKRSILSMFLGKKGLLDLCIEIDGKEYEMYLLSFISTHGRWNIEKEKDLYYAEARRYNRIFYNAYRNSSDEPEFSREFRRESGFRRCIFHLPQENASPDDRKIILVYPTPRCLSHTEKKFEYMKSGSVFHGYTVVYLKDFAKHLKTKGVYDNVDQRTS